MKGSKQTSHEKNKQYGYSRGELNLLFRLEELSFAVSSSEVLMQCSLGLLHTFGMGL